MSTDPPKKIRLLQIFLTIGVLLCLAGLIYFLLENLSPTQEDEQKAIQLVQEHKSPGYNIPCKETFDNLAEYYLHVLFLPVRTQWKVIEQDRRYAIVSAQMLDNQHDWPIYRWRVDFKNNTVEALEEISLCP